MSYENELPLDTPYNTELDDPANAAYTNLKEEIENVVSIFGYNFFSDSCYARKYFAIRYNP